MKWKNGQGGRGWGSERKISSAFCSRITPALQAKKIILFYFFSCCLINCSFEQALQHILDGHFSNPG